MLVDKLFSYFEIVIELSTFAGVAIQLAEDTIELPTSDHSSSSRFVQINDSILEEIIAEHASPT
jgi:hypothetical protein